MALTPPLPKPEAQRVTTHCPYCALNCGLQLDVVDGRIAERVRWKESPLTRGALCSKGTTAHEQVHHPERLTMPLLRVGGDFVEIGWDEALGRAADGFQRIAGDHGADANALLSGGGLTNEKVYLIGKFARLALKTRHVDYNGRFCMAAAGKANMLAFGGDRMMTPLSELERAEVVVVVGANLSSAFPVGIPPLLNRVRKRGGRVIVVDPRGSRFVQDGDLHLQLRPGTDAVLFGGLLQEVIQQGLVDEAFVRDRTSGFGSVVADVQQNDLASIAARADVPAEEIREAANLIGSTRQCMYLHGRGPEQQLDGVGNVLSIINLGLACGHVGRPGAGINMLTGQRNGQGGREWGQRCDQLPAGRSIEDEEDRRVVAGRWGIGADQLPRTGATYTEILHLAGSGAVRGLLSIGTNMSVSAPDLQAVGEQMAALEHCVVIDPFFSASARHADIVLPGSTFAEEAGTITTIEGRVVRCDQVVGPIAGRGDLDLIQDLAGRLGAGAFFNFESPRSVFDEMCIVSADGLVDYSGITWDRVRDDDGVFWPCPAPDHPGTPQLYVDRFWHADDCARFIPVGAGSQPQLVDDDFPLVLTNGRVLAHFLSGNQTMRIEAQNDLAPVPVLEVHPETASLLELDPHAHVQITSRIGSSVVAWVENAELRTDTVFLPYHWSECNVLVAADLDPRCKIPGFKYTAVSIQTAPDDRGSCAVGEGLQPGLLAFVGGEAALD